MGGYRLNRRTTHKTQGTPLSGFAVDVTVRLNKDGNPSVDDHNGDSMAFNTLDEFMEFFQSEVRRNAEEHFAEAVDA